MISIGMGQLQQACLSGFSSPFILKTNASWVRRRLDHWLSQTLPPTHQPKAIHETELANCFGNPEVATCWGGSLLF